MKIASVCKVYPTQRSGGMPFVCQDRARQLVKDGHEVHVLTTGRDTHKGELLNDEGVEAHHMPCKPGGYSAEFAKHCLTHCKSFSPDILHFDSFNVDHPWWKDITSCPRALTLHGFSWGSYFTRWNTYTRHGGTPPPLDHEGIARERSAMMDFDCVIGISVHEHWTLRDPMGLFHAKLVYNPIPDYFFKNVTESPSTDKKRYLLSAISGQHERGFDLACRAAQKAGVEVVVPEAKDRTEMPTLIDSCSALLLPTCYAQGLDLSVGEALIRRRPVIATATGSYLREAELNGIYHGGIKLIPLVGYDALIQALSEPWNGTDDNVNWDSVQTHLHTPSTHTREWLQAILG